MSKLKIFILIVIITIGLFILTGCNNIQSYANTEKRFIQITDEGCFGVYVDTKTNVMYAVSTSSYNYGTVTLLVDTDGKPLLYNQ